MYVFAVVCFDQVLVYSLPEFPKRLFGGARTFASKSLGYLCATSRVGGQEFIET
jgi:hypothetical protein